jgi:hypothetical protein
MNSSRYLYSSVRCALAVVPTLSAVAVVLPACSSADESVVDPALEDISDDVSAVKTGEGGFQIEVKKLSAIEKKLGLSGKYTLAISAEGTDFAWTAERNRGASVKFEDSFRPNGSEAILEDMQTAIKRKDHKLFNAAYSAMQKKGVLRLGKVGGVPNADAMELRALLYSKGRINTLTQGRTSSVPSLRSSAADTILQKNDCYGRWRSSFAWNAAALYTLAQAVGASPGCTPPIALFTGAACIGAWGAFSYSFAEAITNEMEYNCCMGYKARGMFCTCEQLYPEAKNVRTVRNNSAKTMACLGEPQEDPGGGGGGGGGECNGGGCGSGPCNYPCGN